MVIQALRTAFQIRPRAQAIDDAYCSCDPFTCGSIYLLLVVSAFTADQPVLLSILFFARIPQPERQFSLESRQQ